MNSSKPTIKLRFHCEPSLRNPYYVVIETVTAFLVHIDGSLEEVAKVDLDIEVGKHSLEAVAGLLSRSMADELDARVVSMNYVEEDKSNGAE